MREVTDQFAEDTGDSRTVVETFTVTVLSCEHTIETPGRSYRSPLQQAALPRAHELGRRPDNYDTEEQP